MISEAKLEANRRNAMRSTGPRDTSRSRLNAVKHGMTAETTVIPGEDAAAFEARLGAFREQFRPRNLIESDALESIVRSVWLSDRAHRAAVARVTERLEHLADDTARADRDQAAELGQRLFWRLNRPLPLGPKDDPETTVGYPEFAVPGSPDHPARLVPRIEATVAGCDLLLERWQELAHRAAAEGMWQASDGFKAIRLIGKLASDVADDDEVAVIISSTVMLTTKPRPKFADFWVGDPPIGYDKHGNVDDDPRAEALVDDEEHQRKLLAFERVIDEFNYAQKSQYDEWCKPFSKRLQRSPLKGLGPADAEEARSLLASLAAAHIKRLQVIRAHNQRLADSDAARAPAKLAVEPGHEGDLDRRYTLARERAVQRAFAEFMKARKMSKSGEMPHVFEEETIEPDAAENGLVPADSDEADLANLAPEPIVVPKVSARDWCGKSHDDAAVFRNEADLVSGPSSVVSRENATHAIGSTDPTAGAPEPVFRKEATAAESGEGEPPGEPMAGVAQTELRPPGAPGRQVAFFRNKATTIREPARANGHRDPSRARPGGVTATPRIDRRRPPKAAQSEARALKEALDVLRALTGRVP
jgi:hypothetical protein